MLMSSLVGFVGGTLCSLCEQTTTASCGARSGGRAGRRTWGDRRLNRFGTLRLACLGPAYRRQNCMRTHCPCKRPTSL